MKKGFEKIEHIGIYSSDTKRLADWYVNTFGLIIGLKIEKNLDSKSVYFLKSDGVKIEILPSDENEKRVRNIKDPGFSHIGITVNDFGYVEEYLKSRGVEIKGSRKTSVGWKIGYVEDIDGNIIEIVCRTK